MLSASSHWQSIVSSFFFNENGNVSYSARIVVCQTITSYQSSAAFIFQQLGFTIHNLGFLSCLINLTLLNATHVNIGPDHKHTLLLIFQVLQSIQLFITKLSKQLLYTLPKIAGSNQCTLCNECDLVFIWCVFIVFCIFRDILIIYYIISSAKQYS